MKERPILFSAPMVRAILEGRMTVTRCIVKRGRVAPAQFGLPLRVFDERYVGVELPCPYGQPGDRLWLREAWRSAAGLNDLSGKQIAERCLEAGYRLPWAPLQYDADGVSNEHWHGFGDRNGSAAVGRYRHARFMPRWASRITLEVTGVRVERLQDITSEQILAEGVQIPVDAATGNELIDVSTKHGPSYFIPPGKFGDRNARLLGHWAALWVAINGIDSWNANPWVWCVSFRRI